MLCGKILFQTCIIIWHCFLWLTINHIVLFQPWDKNNNSCHCKMLICCNYSISIVCISCVGIMTVHLVCVRRIGGVAAMVLVVIASVTTGATKINPLIGTQIGLPASSLWLKTFHTKNLMMAGEGIHIAVWRKFIRKLITFSRVLEHFNFCQNWKYLSSSSLSIPIIISFIIWKGKIQNLYYRMIS